MALETIVAGIGVLAVAVSWYGLQAVALRDLRDEPRVRGDNKVLWALAILCLPYAGAIAYLSVGPMTLRRRAARPALRVVRSVGRAAHAEPERPAPSAFADLEPDRPARRPEPMTAHNGPSAARPSGRPVSPLRSVPGSASRPRPAAIGPAGTVMARSLAHDPVIGTDLGELDQRPSALRPLMPAADLGIRWPGPARPAAQQHDLHD